MTQGIMSCNIGDYGFTRTHTHEHEGIIMKSQYTEEAICPQCSGQRKVCSLVENVMKIEICSLCKGAGKVVKEITIEYKTIEGI